MAKRFDSAKLTGIPARLRQAPLWRDESGATAMIVGLGATMLVGFAGLGTEMGLWYFNHRTLQNAADSAAMSAEAALFQSDGSYVAEAKATAARYGFVDGTGGVSVTINKPPASGAYAAATDAVEVIISEPQTRLFTALFSKNALTQTARAVAQVGSNGNGCVVTLDKHAVDDVFNNGNTQLNLKSCNLYVNSSACDAISESGNNTSINAPFIYVVANPACNGVTTTGNNAGISNGTTLLSHVTPINDPYANVPAPGSHDPSCNSSTPTTYDGGKSGITLQPGNYCGGIIATGGTINLSPGVYVIDGGQFAASGNANITGSGVTIFLTGSGSNYATAQFSGNANLTLSPPDTGPSAGISIFQDRNAPTSDPSTITQGTTSGGTSPGGTTTGGITSAGTTNTTLDVTPTSGTVNQIGAGNGTLDVTGVTYFPNQEVVWNGNGTGGSPACSQVVALRLRIVGNSTFSNNCAGVPGVANIGAIPARLVE